ncbi:hypothetical protein [Paraburkholderia hospita]|uniref:phage fiber-tail adaptor protein n=1 Tax=Paraburkholderia hospita TaxID=169430 RepID=UPI0008A791AD|nr:hypothetical protein [Paraburkholderia hospita]SEH89822.1 hypothetical protein SAMN05192544_1011150 [Paraburkholderia hospita]
MKRPSDQLDYDIDFSRWLPEGDTIISATAEVLNADSMVSAVQVVPQASSVKVWLIDGVSGKTANVLVTATTEQNRVKQVEFQVRVRD